MEIAVLLNNYNSRQNILAIQKGWIKSDVYSFWAWCRELKPIWQLPMNIEWKFPAKNVIKYKQYCEFIKKQEDLTNIVIMLNILTVKYNTFSGSEHITQKVLSKCYNSQKFRELIFTVQIYSIVFTSKTANKI